MTFATVVTSTVLPGNTQCRTGKPSRVSDEAAAKLIDFLLAIAHQMEDHYSQQLYRYHNAIDERQPDLWSDTDPPF